ncbi:MAG: DUF1501 domain-containing protein [Planctomycetaceae bacterium]
MHSPPDPMLNPARTTWTAPRYLIDRRTALQVGASGVVGAALPVTARPALAASAAGARAKSVLLVICSGGPSQLDVWDPSPKRPPRSAANSPRSPPPRPASWSASICRGWPAAQSLVAIVRTLKHVEGNHLLAMHVALTGRPTPVPRTASDLDRVESRFDFFRNFAAARLRPAEARRHPTGVTLPNYFIEGALTWPGQHAGFLGARHDPWQINQDPNDPNFKVDVLNLPADVAFHAAGLRRVLLDAVNGSAADLATARTKAIADQYDVAFHCSAPKKSRRL